MNDPDIFKERKEKRVSTPYGEVFNYDSCTTSLHTATEPTVHVAVKNKVSY